MTQNQIANDLKEGFANLEAGRVAQAADLCRKVLSHDPKCVEGHFLVGLVSLEMKDPRTAVRAFGSVTTLDPSHGAGWAQLARTFLRIGQPARAETALTQAEANKPHDPATMDLIGVCHSLLGNQNAALDWYGRALERAPGQAAFSVNFASALVFLGKTGEARTFLENLIVRHPGVAQAEWLLSSVSKPESPERPARLLDQASRAKDPNERAFLGYAAGKEFEDLEDWDAAFRAFALGARAKRSVVDYDEAREQAMFVALTETFTAGWNTVIDQRAAETSAMEAEDPSPIFVVGQPRTGTTLIERIITSHSAVESAGELQQFGLSVRRLAQAGGDRWSAEAVKASAGLDMAALGREYLRATRPMRSDAPRFVDKLPGNYLHVPLILAALPNAKIVHLTRHPADSCFSSYKQLFAEAYLHSYDQEEMARHHARYYRLMDHWRTSFSGRFLDISYEETVADVEPHARQLIGFLDLDWEDACLDFHKSTAPVATASAVQVREQAHTRSVGRWRRYEPHVAAMIQTLKNEGIAI